MWEAPDTLPSGGVIRGRDAILEQYGGTMGRQAGVVLYVLALVTVVVGVDVLFFRHRFWERLTVNVGIRPGVRGVLFEVPEASMSGTPR